ncbi:MAG: PepSY-associated TM helix domain-containing protein [Burkholderiales bacterium]
MSTFDSTVQHANPSASGVRPLHRVFWRLHFWAGLITAPIVLFAAFTGLLYVFTPQIEAWLHADLDSVPVQAQQTRLDDQVAAAQAALPGQELRYVVPGFAPGDTTQVVFKPLASPHAGHGQATALHDHGLPMGTIAYVNPYTGQVVGTLQEMARFKTWAKKLHSSALQGDRWRWPLELAASWMLVMFATGLYLWWPSTEQRRVAGWRAYRPRTGRGRLAWRDWHGLLAMLMGVVLCTLLVTGLTWSEHAGGRFKAMQKALQQDSPRVPKSLRSSPSAQAAPLGWQAVADQAARLTPPVSVMITPPSGPLGIWRIENFDRSQPQGRFGLALDAYSGQTLFYSGWEAMPLVSRATAIGIPFHRGEFGWWNQLLLVLAALTAIFSVVSGFVMWWLRRPQGKLAAPPVGRAHWRTISRPQAAVLLVLIGLLSYAMPLFGWSLMLFILLEVLRLLFLSRPTAQAV